jgi:hypothetical protein
VRSVEFHEKRCAGLSDCSERPAPR